MFYEILPLHQVRGVYIILFYFRCTITNFHMSVYWIVKNYRMYFFRFNYISWHAYLSGLIVFPAIKMFNDWIVFATPVDVSLSDLCHILFLPYVKDVIIGNYCRFTPMLQCHTHKRHSNVNSFNNTKAMRMSKAHTSFNQYEKKGFLKRFSGESS